jgi:hypothetical protein
LGIITPFLSGNGATSFGALTRRSSISPHEQRGFPSRPAEHGLAALFTVLITTNPSKMKTLF